MPPKSWESLPANSALRRNLEKSARQRSEASPLPPASSDNGSESDEYRPKTSAKADKGKFGAKATDTGTKRPEIPPAVKTSAKSRGEPLVYASESDEENVSAQRRHQAGSSNKRQVANDNEPDSDLGSIERRGIRRRTVSLPNDAKIGEPLRQSALSNPSTRRQRHSLLAGQGSTSFGDNVHPPLSPKRVTGQGHSDLEDTVRPTNKKTRVRFQDPLVTDNDNESDHSGTDDAVVENVSSSTSGRKGGPSKKDDLPKVSKKAEADAKRAAKVAEKEAAKAAEDARKAAIPPHLRARLNGYVMTAEQQAERRAHYAARGKQLLAAQIQGVDGRTAHDRPIPSLQPTTSRGGGPTATETQTLGTANLMPGSAITPAGQGVLLHGLADREFQSQQFPLQVDIGNIMKCLLTGFASKYPDHFEVPDTPALDRGWVDGPATRRLASMTTRITTWQPSNKDQPGNQARRKTSAGKTDQSKNRSTRAKKVSADVEDDEEVVHEDEDEEEFDDKGAGEVSSVTARRIKTARKAVTDKESDAESSDGADEEDDEVDPPEDYAAPVTRSARQGRGGTSSSRHQAVPRRDTDDDVLEDDNLGNTDNRGVMRGDDSADVDGADSQDEDYTAVSSRSDTLGRPTSGRIAGGPSRLASNDPNVPTKKLPHGWKEGMAMPGLTINPWSEAEPTSPARASSSRTRQLDPPPASPRRGGLRRESRAIDRV